jgi:hypothetical protein
VSALATAGVALCCWVSLCSCSTGGEDRSDGSVDQKLRLDTPLPPRLQATIAPSAALFDQTITLKILAFNFRLVPVDEPAESGRGHCLVSLLPEGEDRAITLFKVSSREKQFRLRDFETLSELQPGQHRIIAQLYLNDGTAIGGEAKVELTLVVCSEAPCP